MHRVYTNQSCNDTVIKYHTVYGSHCFNRARWRLDGLGLGIA